MIANEHEQVSLPEDDELGIAALPSHVLVALDHVQPEERAGVFNVVKAFARGETASTPLPGDDTLFTQQAAPELLVFVRREPGKAIQVLDIVRPATLRLFADAASNR